MKVDLYHEGVMQEMRVFEDTPIWIEAMFYQSGRDRKKMIELMREFQGLWYTEGLKEKAREEFLKLFPKKEAA